MKIFTLFLCLHLVLVILLPITGVAQSVGINNSAPHASAILDVKSNTKGMLIPRISTSSRIAIVNPAKGLMVYDTTANSFWFYNGASWGAIAAGVSGWNLTGNAGTNPAVNFIGTTDNNDVIFKRSNIWGGRISVLNTSYGTGALNPASTGIYNTANGVNALTSNTIGEGNTASGFAALASNTEGAKNTANGYAALFTNTIGNANTTNGYAALFLNTVGYNNTANGVEALRNNTNGSDNTANGSKALYSNTEGYENTANGNIALYNNLRGISNTGIGYGALFENTDGSENTAIGYAALRFNTTGNRNIAIGYESGTHYNTPNLTNTISIGNNGAFLNQVSNQAIIGNSSTVFIGGAVNWGIVSDARIKNNVQEDVKGLDFILRLRPVTYHISNAAISAITKTTDTTNFAGKYDGEKVKYTGFLAQEVEQAAKAANYDFSGYVTPKNERDLYKIRYAEFVVPLVKAMQEQQQMITTLQEQAEAAKANILQQTANHQTTIAELKMQMAEMKKEIELLKKK